MFSEFRIGILYPIIVAAILGVSGWFYRTELRAWIVHSLDGVTHEELAAAKAAAAGTAACKNIVGNPATGTDTSVGLSSSIAIDTQDARDGWRLKTFWCDIPSMSINDHAGYNLTQRYDEKGGTCLLRTQVTRSVTAQGYMCHGIP